MNDDTEPVWAINTINSLFDSTEFAGVGKPLVQDLYTDFGLGFGLHRQEQSIGIAIHDAERTRTRFLNGASNFSWLRLPAAVTEQFQSVTATGSLGHLKKATATDREKSGLGQIGGFRL